ncbi:hypothetical protein ACQ4PT_046687 [Festuca glaucescens]
MKLPFWKAWLLSREGRVVYVQAVMTASVVYQLLALDLDPWFLKAVDKLRRSFLWAGKDEVLGGCCPAAWHLVCQPKSLGGLGLHNLRCMNVALRTRWIWQQKTDTSKPWSGLDLEASSDARGLFNASVHITIGDGSSVLFWEDAWIGGLSVAAIAPALLKLVWPSIQKHRTVKEGLLANSWALDIAGVLSVDATVGYLRLWSAIMAVPRAEGAQEASDSFRWKWEGSGSFSSRSAYRLMFQGTTGLPVAPLVWHSFAPLKFKLHAWLALRRRCWTTDRRLRRGLASHVLCPLCGGADETIDHITLHCSFARGIWSGLVARLRLPDVTPTGVLAISDWWLQASLEKHQVAA